MRKIIILLQAGGLSRAISSNFLPWIAERCIILAQREGLFRVCFELVRTFSVEISETPPPTNARITVRNTPFLVDHESGEYLLQFWIHFI